MTSEPASRVEELGFCGLSPSICPACGVWLETAAGVSQCPICDSAWRTARVDPCPHLASVRLRDAAETELDVCPVHAALLLQGDWSGAEVVAGEPYAPDLLDLDALPLDMYAFVLRERRTTAEMLVQVHRSIAFARAQSAELLKAWALAEEHARRARLHPSPERPRFYGPRKPRRVLGRWIDTDRERSAGAAISLKWKCPRCKRTWWRHYATDPPWRYREPCSACGPIWGTYPS